MSVAKERDYYEHFEPREDSLFFRIGEGGVICFHGRNCHIRKRMSGEQRDHLFQDSSFVRISPDCYVNLKGITDVEEHALIFGEKNYGDKRIPVSRRVRAEILERLGKLDQLAN